MTSPNERQGRALAERAFRRTLSECKFGVVAPHEPPAIGGDVHRFGHAFEADESSLPSYERVGVDAANDAAAWAQAVGGDVAILDGPRLLMSSRPFINFESMTMRRQFVWTVVGRDTKGTPT